MRLFAYCEATNWSILPLAGGWMDQHPQFIDEIEVIFKERGKAEKEKADREKNRKGR